jgi:VWFA-related protein
MKHALLAIIVIGLYAPLPARQTQIARTTTTGVVIDLSVVDRDGKPVVDLRPDEFELSEDGKRQQIVAVSLVSGGVVRALDAAPAAASTGNAEAAGAVAGAGRVRLLPDKTPSVTAILFDSLSPETRPLAHRAATAYLATLSPPNDYAGVFLSGAKLKSFAGFTNRADVLHGALASLASTAPTTVSSQSERTGYSRVQQLPLDPNQPVTAGAESGAGWINPAEREKYLMGGGPEPLFVKMELRMFETYQQFLAEFQGEASFAGLRSVVDSMSVLPGRKSILYFAETLPVTDRLKPRFDALIAEANRGNITVYSIDAAGLRVQSEEAKVGRNIAVAGAQGVGDSERSAGAWTKDLERQEQILSSRAGAVLGRLARETGGFLLDNTNNLAAGVARMQQERTTYYLLAYEPTNTAADGKFRRVSVKVKRPRVTVNARPGYVAAAR